MSDPLRRLIDGFTAFRQEHFVEAPELYRSLVEEGQRPQVLIVGCSDSRVDPAIVTCARPGDLFIVRNVAAIVPPYRDDHLPKGTTSAIEFGVRGLGVRHLVLLGHEGCGGLALLARLASPEGRESSGFEFLSDWVSIVATARDLVLEADLPEPLLQRTLEEAALLVSLGNLLQFWWVREAVEAGRLALHAWYFSFVGGRLLIFDPALYRFREPDGGETSPADWSVVTTPPDIAHFVAEAKRAG